MKKDVKDVWKIVVVAWISTSILTGIALILTCDPLCLLALLIPAISSTYLLDNGNGW